jgi:hypothetical protein
LRDHRLVAVCRRRRVARGVARRRAFISPHAS